MLDWGPLTVIKPENAAQGRGVRLVRTSDVKWIDPLNWPRDDPRHGQAMAAQQFIDTGAHATSFRVMTVFGQPIYSIASISLDERPLLELDRGGHVDLPIASNAGARLLELNFDAGIIQLGAAVYNAFPSAPVQGVDVIREAATGKLFVLEFNPRGHTWHLSSPYFRSLRQQFGLDLYGQFNALDTIGDVIVTRVRAEAA
jgi:hypothetical protein